MKIASPFGTSINISPDTCSTPITDFGKIYNKNIKTILFKIVVEKHTSIRTCQIYQLVLFVPG